MQTNRTAYRITARPALLTALVLMIPLLAMQFTTEVNWTGSDFVFAGILVFGTLGAYGLLTTRAPNPPYRAAVGLALAGAFVTVWVNAAVGATDSEADALYLAALAIGAVGALVARFRPRGMAVAMIVTAVAVASVAAIAFASGVVPPHNTPLRLIGISVFFASMFVGSAALFRVAARRGPEPGEP